MFTRRLHRRDARALIASLLMLTIGALFFVSAISAACSNGAEAAQPLNACMERSLSASVSYHGDILQRTILDTFVPLVFVLATTFFIAQAIVDIVLIMRIRLACLRWVWARRMSFSSTQRYVPTYAASHGG